MTLSRPKAIKKGIKTKAEVAEVAEVAKVVEEVVEKVAVVIHHGILQLHAIRVAIQGTYHLTALTKIRLNRSL